MTTGPDRDQTTIPAGTALVTSAGWETDPEDGQEVFVLRLEFSNGPPDLPLNVVWNAIPVKVQLA